MHANQIIYLKIARYVVYKREYYVLMRIKLEQ